MKLDDFAQRIWAVLHDLVIQPVARLVLGLNHGDRTVFVILLATAAALGFVIGRRRTGRTGWHRTSGAWPFPTFQNRGEAVVARVLRSHFGPPNYHLMNHVTIRMADGTTQIDHILVSRFGVFVIETKDYNGWIFASAEGAKWTQVHFRWHFEFQNPIRQNYRHIRAVQGLLDFLPPEAVKSVVVFCGNAGFKTEIPQGVTTIDQLAEYLEQQTVVIMSLNRQQFCVGRLESARLAISHETDVEHAQSLARRHGSGP
jgi:hypothetical protein